jgi:hypothetical protein
MGYNVGELSCLAELGPKDLAQSANGHGSLGPQRPSHEECQ